MPELKLLWKLLFAAHHTHVDQILARKGTYGLPHCGRSHVRHWPQPFCLLVRTGTLQQTLYEILLIILQAHFVSLATNIFTALHSLCILSVTAWFIYQLKHESRWARWILRNTSWIRIIIKRIGIAMTWRWTALQWISSSTERSYNECKLRLLHLLRNIFWCFILFNKSQSKLTSNFIKGNWDEQPRRLSDPQGLQKQLESRLARPVPYLKGPSVLTIFIQKVLHRSREGNLVSWSLSR